MTEALKQLKQDHAVRNAARDVVKRDIEFLKEDVSAGGGVKQRIKTRASDSATDVMDEAREIAAEHKVALAAGAGLIALIILRKPIIAVLSGLALFGSSDDEDADDEYDDGNGYYDDQEASFALWRHPIRAAKYLYWRFT